MLWVRCGRRLFALCLTRCGWQGGGWCRACVWCVSLLVLWYLLDICLLICGVLVRSATLCIIQPRWHPFCTVLVRHARRHHRHGWLSLFEATRAFARLILLNQTFHLGPQTIHEVLCRVLRRPPQLPPRPLRLAPRVSEQDFDEDLHARVCACQSHNLLIREYKHAPGCHSKRPSPARSTPRASATGCARARTARPPRPSELHSC